MEGKDLVCTSLGPEMPEGCRGGRGAGRKLGRGVADTADGARAAVYWEQQELGFCCCHATNTEHGSRLVDPHEVLGFMNVLSDRARRVGLGELIGFYGCRKEGHFTVMAVNTYLYFNGPTPRGGRLHIRFIAELQGNVITPATLDRVLGGQPHGQIHYTKCK